MAFTVEEISGAHHEEIKREKLPLTRETAAGLELRSDKSNPGRHNFKRVSERPIPEFTASDEQLRLVVAQTAYSRFRPGPWERVPDGLTADPVGLVTLAAMRFEVLKNAQPHFLTVLNTTRDYVAILSAAADIRSAVTRLRYNAMRLGFAVKRTKRWKGRTACPTGSPDWYARLALAKARPEVKERRRAGMKTPVPIRRLHSR